MALIFRPRCRICRRCCGSRAASGQQPAAVYSSCSCSVAKVQGLRIPCRSAQQADSSAKRYMSFVHTGGFRKVGGCCLGISPEKRNAKFAGGARCRWTSHVHTLRSGHLKPIAVNLSLISVMEPDDNPFRRPAGQASINSTSNPLPAVAADAVDGTGQRQCGCARLAEANATAQQSITVGADVLGSLQTQRAQLLSTQGTLAQQQSDLNRAGLCRNRGVCGRPARPERLTCRGCPKPETA